MAENNGHHMRLGSSRKSRSPTASAALLSNRTSLSSPNSPTSKANNGNAPSRGRQLWNVAIDNILEHEHTTPASSSMASSTGGGDPTGWYNLTMRVMQLNASPILSTAASPALHKDNWQQRRYNFLTKNSVFGGELKDELVEQTGAIEQGTDVEHRPIIATSQMTTSGSSDLEVSNVKRESIFGMAVMGVRNLLAEDEGDEQPNAADVSLKNIVSSSGGVIQEEPSASGSVGLDEHDRGSGNARPCVQCTQTDGDPLPTTVIVSPRNGTLTNHRRFNFFTPFNSIYSHFFPGQRQSSKKQQNIVDIQESYRSHRPYFTYWVTFVQIIVCIVSLIVYGYAPLASTQSNNASLTEQQRFDLTSNPWFGPHPSDLIRLGAKYTPCIRSHDEVKDKYKKQTRLEAMSGCCIDSATGRCMQTLSEQCLPRSGLTWYQKPLKAPGPTQNNVIYPAVCGFTPETCTKQRIGNVLRSDESSWSLTVADSKRLKWSPNAIKWPICLEQDYRRIATNISLYPYMQCNNIARPCCVGILGDCVLTSKDDCRRRRGIYHPEAHLCSQIDCIQSVCGMLEFFVVRLPDQVYRFWTVLFIHAGLIHLVITIVFQYTIMRPLEKLAGCIRVMIIYIVSGFVGSLASAIFLRDSIQVGPGGGQLAILACYLSELFLGWRSLKRPWIPFFKIAICLLLLLTVGLLPLVDNYSQCFGFIFGFMVNMIVFPDVSFRKNVRRLVVVTTSLAITIALFIALIVLFYTLPFKCASCKLFNCPFGKICGNEKRDLV